MEKRRRNVTPYPIEVSWLKRLDAGKSYQEIMAEAKATPAGFRADMSLARRYVEAAERRQQAGMIAEALMPLIAAIYGKKVGG